MSFGSAFAVFACIVLGVPLVALAALVLRRRKASERFEAPPRAPLVRAAFEAGVARMQKTARRNRVSFALTGQWPELAPLTPDERGQLRHALVEATRLPNDTLDAIVERAAAAVEAE